MTAVGTANRASESQDQETEKSNADPKSFDALLTQALLIARAAPEALVSDVVSWHGHIPFAQALVAIAKPRLVVELGVHKGDSYRALVDAMARYGVEGRAFGIDSWSGDEHAGSYEGDAVLKEVMSRNEPFAEFSTLLRKTFDEALADFQDGTIDLLHIDGYHTYEAVRHDFESWEPKLSQRAIVLFHDTAVRRGDFGVYRFWEEVSAGRLAYNFEHSNGLGILCTGDRIGGKARRLIELLLERHENGLAPAMLFEAIGDAFAGRIATRVFRQMYDAKQAEAEAIQSASMAEIERLNAEIVQIRKEGQAALDRAELNRQLAETTGPMHGPQADSVAEIGRLETAIERLNEDVARMSAEIVSVRRDEVGRLHTASAATIGRLETAIERLNEDVARISAEIVSVRRDEIGRLDAAIEAVRDLATTAESHAQEAQPAAKEQAQLSRRRQLASHVRRAAGAARRLGISIARVVTRNTLNVLPMRPETRVGLKVFLIKRYGHLIGRTVTGRSYDASNGAQVALHTVSDRYLEIARAATGKPAEIPKRSVSIIIPVYNQIDFTLRCLESVRRNSGDVEHEIIVVDDCSTDETPIELSQRDDISFIRNARNLGFIGSCNAGLARATKEYVLFLNNDTEVGPAWLSALVNTFELNDHVGLVGSKLIYPDGQLQEAGGIIWDDFSGWNWGRLQDCDDPRFNFVRRADYCSGASLMLPRSLATALGGFDPEFTPAYGEDSDLAFKIRSLGLSVLYQPLSQVIHHEGVSSGTDITQGVKAYQVVNARKLAERWAPVLPHHSPNGEDPDLAATRGHIGRILVIDQITPEPDRDAGSITSLELMRAVRDFGYKVTFIPCSNFTYITHYTDLLAALGIESVLHPWTKSVREHLQRFGRHYDAVIIFRFNSASEHLDAVRELAPQAKVIYHTSDLHFLREERAQMVDNHDIPERNHSFEKTKAAELRIAEQADLTILHSQFERDLLAELIPGKPVVVFPWIYQPRGAGKPPAQRRDLVFLGGYRHYPNVDAVTHFARDVLPLLLSRNPDIVFHAVGSNPPEAMLELASPNLKITGFVEDVSPILWNARMMVAPLRYGAGLKGKIVTAMAHGLPVITTSIGAEGMGLTDGVDVLVADDPAAMTAAIEKLNSDDALWSSLSEAGLDYVARTTSRQVGYSIVKDSLETVGLSTVARATDAGTGHEFHAAFGSPAVLLDAPTLVAAAGDGPGADGILVVPPALAGVALEGWRVATAGTATGPAGRVVAIVDGTSDAEVAAITRMLPRLVRRGGRATIIFAPARLVLRGGTYAVMRPFAELAPTAPVRPAHVQHGARLAALGGTLNWRADAAILGFAGLIFADWTP